MFESLNAGWRPLGKRFNTPIRHIAYITDNLVAGRCPLRKKPITDALHVTANQKFSRYPVCHCKGSTLSMSGTETIGQDLVLCRPECSSTRSVA
jgi:hypothetical protein